MAQVILQVEGMSCEHCEKAVKDAVSALAGVSSVAVSLADKRVTVDYDGATANEAQIKEAIEDQGYDIA